MTDIKRFSMSDWDDFQKDVDYHTEQSVRLDTVEMLPVRWLWEGFIPRGMVTILTGEEGLGKSQLAMKIAAEFSSKEKWGGTNPEDGQPGGLVKLYSAEDPLQQVLVPRMRANGANMRHIYAEGIDIQTFLPDGIDDMARGIEELGFGMIIIDPVIAYIGSKHDSNSAQDVRYIMRKLSDLAQVSGVVILGVMHPKKGEETQALHKMIGGSSAFGQAARSVLGVCRHPEDEDQRIVGRIKGNLNRPPTPYIYEIVGTTLETPDHVEIPTSRVKFIGKVDGEFDFIGALQGRAPSSEEDDGRGVKQQDAMTFLRAHLALGPVKASQLRTMVQGQSFSYGTMDAAAHALGVERPVIDGSTHWKLPSREGD